MKLTRERKIYGAVLLIGLGFLGFDQLRGGAGADDLAGGQGDELLLVSSTTSSASDKQSNLSTSAADEISLAARLASLSEKTGSTAPADIRDAFRPAEGWLTKRAPVQATIATVTPSEQFIASHKLSAISTSAQGDAVAVVDGTLLRVGGWINGYRLIAVDRA